MHWYTDVIRKYAVFNGRAARPEFWWFVLFNLIVAAVINVVVGIIAAAAAGRSWAISTRWPCCLPSLGVGIRRLHDTNRTGWWYLLVFIPIIGWIVLIVFLGNGQRPRVEQLRPEPAEPGSGARACTSIRRPASACPRHRGSIRRPVSR